jgi:hypothetical protein
MRAAVAKVPGASIREASEQIWMISVGRDSGGFISFMPAPIPTGEAEAAADNLLWPDGPASAKHASHAIVSYSPASGDPVDGLLGLSRLAVAALDAMDGIAVYWGNGSLTVPAALFREFASGATRSHLPLPIWVRFQPWAPRPDVVGIYTVGLSQFGLMDIECDGSPWKAGRLTEFCMDLAHYLVTSGPVVKDGETVGSSEDERITVRHVRGSREPEKFVYKLVFEATA